MKATTLGEVKEAIGAELVQGDPGVVVSRVGTDTRTLAGGELFFALQGACFDGHCFVSRAAALGAAGLVVSQEVAVPAGVAVLRVDDTLRALQDLARFNRRRCGIPLVAVTGSTGKTTTKDLVTAVLTTRLRVLATHENLNNEIGVPLTLLQMDASHQAAVVELGMRGPGEIDLLAGIAQPTGGVISNVGETHLELLGSVENIARAKGELLEHIPASGFALLHADSPALAVQARRCRGRVTFFGEAPDAALRLVEYRPVPGGCTVGVRFGDRTAEFQLPFLGRHLAVNALAAVGVGLEMGLSKDEIRAGLASARLSSLRQDVVESSRFIIINDTYNASPASVRAALEVLRDLAAGRPAVAVLGGMLELGAQSAVAHREVGRACVKNHVDYLVTVGELAEGIAEGARTAGLPAARIRSCRTISEAVDAARDLVPQGAVILVKGSRAFRMERVVAGLTGAGDGDGEPETDSCRAPDDAAEPGGGGGET